MKVEIEKDDLRWLMNLAACCDYLDDYDRLTIMEEKYGFQKIWFMIYPYKFYRSKSEAHDNLIEPLDWRQMEIVTDTEKKQIERDIKEFGLREKICPKCGYIQKEIGMGRRWCTMCFKKRDEEIILEDIKSEKTTIRSEKTEKKKET